MTDLIYHYTSFETFRKIIENKSFWLTDLNTSMDCNELDYAKQLVSDISLEVLGHNFPFFAPAENYYALSCTSLPDDFMHFDIYGDKCKGVSIGINTNFIEDSLDKYSAMTVHYHLKFKEVIYDEDLHIKNIRDILNRRYPKWLSDKRITDAYDNSLAVIKSKNFASEHEIRLVYTQDYHGSKTIMVEQGNGEKFFLNDFLLNIGLEKTTEFYPFRFKETILNNLKRKYYELNLEPFGINNIIKKIVIGSQCEFDISYVKSLLELNNINADVIKSSLKLRKN